MSRSELADDGVDRQKYRSVSMSIVAPTTASHFIFFANRFSPINLVDAVCCIALSAHPTQNVFDFVVRRYRHTSRRQSERVDYRPVMQTRCFA
jgi:hypothetical protein